jgi:elongator complex protein 3
MPYRELIEKIIAGEITKDNFEQKKIELARKYNLGNLLKNAEIRKYSKSMVLTRKDEIRLHSILKTKPVRSLSGVSNIAIMWLGEGDYSCPFKCTYCPQGKYSPKSYLGREPATLRAKRNNYNPSMQVKNRLFQLELLGHPTNKCELIIMGGTFMAWHKNLREEFIKSCYDAFNDKESENLDDAIKANETAGHRVIGLTIETRADYCRDHNIKEMFRYGATRVEVGVQSTSDEILQLTKRGHSAEENQRAFAFLRRNGLKITAHWMPGLSGVFG